MIRRILIADEIDTIREKLDQLLKTHDYSVVNADSGDLALAKVREVRPHLAILGVNMSGKNGYEVCHILKSEPELKHIPVVLTFSDSEPVDIMEAHRVGAIRCLPKTIEPETMLSIIELLIAGVKYPYGFNGKDQMGENAEDVDTLDAEEVDSEEDIEDIEFDTDIDIEPMGEDEYLEYEESTQYKFEVFLEPSSSPSPGKVSVKESQASLSVSQEVEKLSETVADETAISEEAASSPTPTITISTQNDKAETKEEVKEETTATKAATPAGTFSPAKADSQSLPSLTGVFPIYNPEENLDSIDDPLQIKSTLSTIKCKDCGAIVSVNDIFCIDCGAAIEDVTPEPQQQKRCEQCGEIINADDIFCLSCGAVL